MTLVIQGTFICGAPSIELQGVTVSLFLFMGLARLLLPCDALHQKPGFQKGVVQLLTEQLLLGLHVSQDLGWGLLIAHSVQVIPVS